MTEETLSIRPFEDMDHHVMSEKLVGILCNKTQNTDPLFFRVLVAYYFSVVATMMRCTIKTHESKNPIPVNLYAISLATSGAGKGKSTAIIENQVIGQFRDRFTEETFEILAQENVPKIAYARSVRKQTDPDDELTAANTEFTGTGPLVFSFDNTTEAALKQMRHKLLMADSGSMNLQIDEIGSNLTGSVEALNAYLELYDVGKIKPKLVKNTKENLRNEDIQGITPTNMMLFGTPSKLLNGSKVEEEFYSMLDTGFARRCFFAYAKNHTRDLGISVDDLYALLTDSSSNGSMESISDHLESLADIINIKKVIVMSVRVAKLFLLYKLQCERFADELPEHEEMKKAEISHRYFKAMKLAGTYAFVDDSPEITEQHFENAVKLAEESGDAFTNLLSRDRNYVKLAKYIANVGREVTHVDLIEDLPFYPKAANQQRDLMTQAIAHGYQNNIIIKKSFNDGVEFMRGETLQRTDLSTMKVSYSSDIAVGYSSVRGPFRDLHNMVQAPGVHWINHHLKAGDKDEGHRQEDDCIPGFNMVVIDVDGGVSIDSAKALLKDYKFLMYTTKRHDPAGEHRFRIIFPINYELKLDAKDFKDFMTNVYAWLPFEVDDGTNQRARKWMSHPGSYEYNDGLLLDALPFIPKTSKNEERKRLVDSQQSMDNLERWVINTTGDGNRNNQLIKYAFILVDVGFDFEGIRTRLCDLNDKLPDKLTEAELMGTIMVTVSKALAKQVS
jgi:hypothetical protein